MYIYIKHNRGNEKKKSCTLCIFRDQRSRTIRPFRSYSSALSTRPPDKRHGKAPEGNIWGFAVPPPPAGYGSRFDSTCPQTNHTTVRFAPFLALLPRLHFQRE